ncbi:MAG: nucleotidyl transferase AbiEii/AbiGii toxin family protein [Bacteroidales bacterium]
MLHTNTILPGTLDLLNSVMTNPEFDPFTLVGGTALALQLGHRISVDLDFFGQREVGSDEFYELTRSLGKIRLMSRSGNILVMDINGVKVDFINYRYLFLKDPLIYGKIRLASLEDIGAMKLAAITGRGRKRDFFDLYFLLKHFPLSSLLVYYRDKYPDGSDFLVMRSLTYFADAEQDENPTMVIPTEWDGVKSIILKEVKKLNS